MRTPLSIGCRFRAVHCARWLLPLLAAMTACGDDDSYPDLASVPTVRTMYTLTVGQDDVSLPPRRLLWHDDHLYYRVGRVFDSQIQSLSVIDGAPGQAIDLVDPADAKDLYSFNDILVLEGDRLLYDVSKQVRSIPIAGGRSTVAVDASAASEGGSTLADLDEQYFYWDFAQLYGPSARWELWRTPRAGGPSEKFVSLEGRILAQQMSVTDGDVVFTTEGQTLDDSAAFVVPRDGGPARQLTKGLLWPHVVGGSVFWTDFLPHLSDGREAFHLSRVRKDGPGPEVVWAPPPDVGPASVASDGAGGLLVQTLQRFTDGLSHSAFWWITADGKATMLAVDTGPESALYSVAAAPDAFYVAQDPLVPAPYAWNIIRVPKPGSAK